MALAGQRTPRATRGAGAGRSQARHALLAEVAARTSCAHRSDDVSLKRRLSCVDDALEPHRPRAAAVLALPTSTLTRLSPVPYSSTSRCFAASASSTACRASMLELLARARSTMLRRPALSLPARVAPRLDRAVARSTASGRGRRGRDRPRCCAPRPLHSTHMPSGELNENDCGDSSGKPTPQRAGARLAVGALARPRPRRRPAARPAAALQRRLDRVGEPARDRRRRCVTRSITSSIVCFFFLSSAVTSSSRCDHAVDAHAREAGLARLVEQLAELALAVARPCGASSVDAASSPAASAARRRSRPPSARSTAPPHWWQRCSPARA